MGKERYPWRAAAGAQGLASCGTIIISSVAHRNMKQVIGRLEKAKLVKGYLV